MSTRTFRLLLLRPHTSAARTYRTLDVIKRLSALKRKQLYALIREDRGIASDWLNENDLDEVAAHTLDAHEVKMGDNQCLLASVACRLAAEWEEGPPPSAPGPDSVFSDQGQLVGEILDDMGRPDDFHDQADDLDDQADDLDD